MNKIILITLLCSTSTIFATQQTEAQKDEANTAQTDEISDTGVRPGKEYVALARLANEETNIPVEITSKMKNIENTLSTLEEEMNKPQSETVMAKLKARISVLQFPSWTTPPLSRYYALLAISETDPEALSTETLKPKVTAVSSAFEKLEKAVDKHASWNLKRKIKKVLKKKKARRSGSIRRWLWDSWLVTSVTRNAVYLYDYFSN